MTVMKTTTVPVKVVVMRRMKTITLTGDRDELSYVIFVLINDEEEVAVSTIKTCGGFQVKCKYMKKVFVL